MRILLDENIPHDLRHFSGWLREAAEKHGFDVLVTGDLSLSYQQNLTGRRMATVSLSAIGWPTIEPHVPRIVAAVNAAESGTFVRRKHTAKTEVI